MCASGLRLFPLQVVHVASQEAAAAHFLEPEGAVQRIGAFIFGLDEEPHAGMPLLVSLLAQCQDKLFPDAKAAEFRQHADRIQIKFAALRLPVKTGLLAGMLAEKLAAEKGYQMKEDAGRGWRRVVASPMPRRIVEIEQVRRLWDECIVITCGGGGVPVIENPDGTLEGVAAVIDKDFAAELLAEQMNADVLMILTEVEKVAINWGKPDQQDLSHMSLSEAVRYVDEGHFAPGSMLPKVQACMKFVRANPDKRAIITSLNKAVEALNGDTGTVVTFA